MAHSYHTLLYAAGIADMDVSLELERELRLAWEFLQQKLRASVRIHYLTLYLVAARWPIRSVSHNFVEVQQYFIYIKEQRLEPIGLTTSEASIFRDPPYPDLWWRLWSRLGRLPQHARRE